MPIIIESAYFTVDLVRQHPDKIFMFGDNAERWGKKGQAVIRDEPNAIGIRTKWRPSTSPDSYFSDDQYSDICALIDEDMDLVDELLRAGVTLVMPEAGFGTGLAEFNIRAPRAYQYLVDRLIGSFNVES